MRADTSPKEGTNERQAVRNEENQRLAGSSGRKTGILRDVCAPAAPPTPEGLLPIKHSILRAPAVNNKEHFRSAVRYSLADARPPGHPGLVRRPEASARLESSGCFWVPEPPS